MFWVLRSASLRHFLWIPTSFLWRNRKNIIWIPVLIWSNELYLAVAQSFRKRKTTTTHPMPPTPSPSPPSKKKKKKKKQQKKRQCFPILIYHTLLRMIKQYEKEKFKVKHLGYWSIFSSEFRLNCLRLFAIFARPVMWSRSFVIKNKTVPVETVWMFETVLHHFANFIV